MLIAKGAVVNEKDNFSNAPVHCATLNGHLPIIDMLKSNGAYVCAPGMR